MTEQEKNTEETQVEEIEESEETEETSEEAEEETEETDDSQDIDYKSELEKLKVVVASDAYKYRQDKREDKEEDTQELTADSIRQIIQEETSKISNSVRKDTLSSKAHSMARDTDEAELALYHLETTLKGGTGDTDQDLKNAFALANQGRNAAVLKEVKRAVDIKKNKADVTGAKKSVKKTAQPHLSDSDAKMIKQFGLVWHPDKLNPDTGEKGTWAKPVKK